MGAGSWCWVRGSVPRCGVQRRVPGLGAGCGVRCPGAGFSAGCWVPGSVPGAGCCVRRPSLIPAEKYGPAHAERRGMGAKRFEELAAWQLSAELLDQIDAAAAKPPLCRDRELCDQLLRAADNAASNIAEGFGRFFPREFARYLGIARGELMEAQSRLRSAVRRRLITQDTFDRCWSLADRAIGATTRLLQAVLRNADEGTSKRSKPRSPVPRSRGAAPRKRQQ